MEKLCRDRNEENKVKSLCRPVIYWVGGWELLLNEMFSKKNLIGGRLLLKSQNTGDHTRVWRWFSDPRSFSTCDLSKLKTHIKLGTKKILPCPCLTPPRHLEYGYNGRQEKVHKVG